MKKKIALSLTTLGFLSFAAPSAYAASEAECAIWICLPGSFPEGCAAASAAMAHRLSRFKPPLPSFSSCSVDDGNPNPSVMDFTYSRAAYIPARRVCNDPFYNDYDYSYCRSWRNEPRKMLKGQICHIDHDGGYNTPEGCTATYQYVDVLIDGEKTGATRYWRGNAMLDSFSE